ncbi:MAG: hypothetical protein IM638_02880 [Bacteroidetes bacterium]|nr:hypothetical protein [Bacteroidota bacterium]
MSIEFENQSMRAVELTPEILLSKCRELKERINSAPGVIHSDYVLNSLSVILSVPILNLLLASGNKRINALIIEDLLLCLEVLDNKDIRPFIPPLIKLAGNDEYLVEAILGLEKKLTIWRWMSRSTVFVRVVFGLLALSILVPTVLSLARQRVVNNDISPLMSRIDSFNKVIEAQNNYRKANPIKINDSILKLAERRNFDSTINSYDYALRSSGQSLIEPKTGDFPACYGIKGLQGKSVNHLRVTVKGTDNVALKLIDLETDVCVRFIYIKAGQTFILSNIPHGLFYLKVTYGINWLSAESLGTCNGLFMNNAKYYETEKAMFFSELPDHDTAQIQNHSLILNSKKITPDWVEIDREYF